MTSSDFEEAKEGFLDDKRIEQSWKTYRKYKSVVNIFESWFRESKLESLSDLDSADLHKFKRYCRNDRENRLW